MKRIKDASSIIGVTRRTLQFYDDEGILSAKRSRENYRLYSEEDFRIAWKIVFLQNMGFRLDEVECGKALDERDEFKTILDYKQTSFNAQRASLGKFIRVVEIIKESGMPPICLNDDYEGSANYVGCIGIITRILGMSDEEVENRGKQLKTIEIADDDNIATGISDEFNKWLNSIESRRSTLIKKELYCYCMERG